MRKTIVSGPGGGPGCRLGGARARLPTSSRSASCRASSIRSIRSCSSAWRRPPRTSDVDVVTQIPPTWGVEAQTPLLDAMVARGDLNYIITAPVDKDQMVGPLKAAVDHGIKIITVDTYLGDGDYVNGAGQLPAQLHRLGQCRGRTHLGARPRQGDRRQGHRLHQFHQPERQLGRRPRQGLQGGDGQGLPGRQGDRARTSTSTTPTRRRSRPRRCWRASPISPACSAPTCSARRARARRSSMPASAARSRSSPTTRPSRPSSSWTRASSAWSWRRSRSTWAISRSPFAAADAAGVTSLPRRVETGFAIIDKNNVKDPAVARFIYQVPGK